MSVRQIYFRIGLGLALFWASVGAAVYQFVSK